jgi:hypothetical protein
MAACRSRLATIRPRVVNDVQLAEYIGRSPSWLSQHRHKLEAQGFPQRLAVLGGNDLVAVDLWLDQLHASVGINASSSVDADELWRRATGQQANGKRKERPN